MQKMRYTPEELGIIKSTFAEDESVLIALRKKMLDFPLSEVEQNLVNFNENTQKVINKTFNPQIDPEAPIHQVIDLWMTVDFKEKTPEQARILFKARDLVLKYIQERLDGKKPKISFKSLSYSDKNDDETNLVKQTARNTILGHVEQQLNQLQFLAGQKDETVEELMERLNKDSAK